MWIWTELNNIYGFYDFKVIIDLPTIMVSFRSGNLLPLYIFVPNFFLISVKFPKFSTLPEKSWVFLNNLALSVFIRIYTWNMNRVWHAKIKSLMNSVKLFKSKNRYNIYLEAPNPSPKKVVVKIFERQPNQWTTMCVYWMKSSREVE